MKTKAIECLKELKIFKPYIKAFKEQNLLTMFERFGGYFVSKDYGMDDKEVDFLLNKVKEIEENKHNKVYAITHDVFNSIGEMYTFLLVTKEDQEYCLDKVESPSPRSNYYAAAYVYNVSFPELSEFGGVIIQTFGGGITRIG